MKVFICWSVSTLCAMIISAILILVFSNPIMPVYSFLIGFMAGMFGVTIGMWWEER